MGKLIFSGCLSVLLMQTFPDSDDKKAAVEIVQLLPSKNPLNVDSKYRTTEEGVEMTDTHFAPHYTDQYQKEPGVMQKIIQTKW